MKSTILALATFVSLTTAHFELTAPKVRGFNENILPQFPCGGQDSVTARSEFPLTNGTVTVVLGHGTTSIEVLVAFGNNPGSAFNTILRRPFTAQGFGNLCINDLVLPPGMNITAGTNATLQVQTNGDPDGGLYNCADITFVQTLSTPQSCPSSNIQISAAEVSGHPNGTAFEGTNPSTTTPTTPTTTPTPTPGAGSVVRASLGGLVLAGAAVFAVVL